MLKKTTFISLVVFFVFTLVGCGETITPEKVDSEVETGEKTVTSKTFSIGESVKMGDLVFTLNSARWDTGNEFLSPEEGERWLALDCTITNNSDKSTTISSMLMFKLYDEENYSCDQEITANTKGSLDGELGAGRKMSGEVAYSVKDTHTNWEFIFEPSVFGFGQAIFKVNKEDIK